MRARAALATVLVLAAAGTTGARAHVGNHEVTVREGYFDPQELRIDPGESVTWNAVSQGHTITADDGRFDFPPDRTTQRGERFSVRFDDNETVYFHCKVHRGFMFGVIVVGDGSPPPPPNSDPPEIRAVPSPAFASLSAALRHAPPNTVVEVEPGTYREAIRIESPGVTLRGTGASPAEVRIEGGSSRAAGITVRADGVRIENLSVRRHTFTGVYAVDAEDLTLDGVLLEENDRYGLRAEGTRRTIVRDAVARTSGRAGFSFIACDPCDALITGSLAETSRIGLQAVNATGLVVLDSTFRANGTGIALTTVAGAPGPPQRGAHIFGNRIESNGARPPHPPPFTDAYEVATGSGIWVAGGWDNRIEGNAIAGNPVFGVVITGFAGPVTGIRVAGNTMGSNGDADIGWDGAGVRTCFGGNVDGAGAPASIRPEADAILAACSSPAPAGQPDPGVAAAILTYA